MRTAEVRAAHRNTRARADDAEQAAATEAALAEQSSTVVALAAVGSVLFTGERFAVRNQGRSHFSRTRRHLQLFDAAGRELPGTRQFGGVRRPRAQSSG